MAHITVEARNSPTGPGVATLDPAGTDIAVVLPDFEDRRYPLLRLVDPYGDTIFSTYQMAGVLAELESLRSETGNVLLDQLIRLAERCRSRPHSYLAFIGD